MIVHDSLVVKRKCALNYHRLSSTIIDYHEPFDQGLKGRSRPLLLRISSAHAIHWSRACHVIFKRAHRVENSTKYRAGDLRIRSDLRIFLLDDRWPPLFFRQITSFLTLSIILKSDNFCHASVFYVTNGGNKLRQLYWMKIWQVDSSVKTNPLSPSHVWKLSSFFLPRKAVFTRSWIEELDHKAKEKSPCRYDAAILPNVFQVVEKLCARN